jgi:hypothetical protein
LWLFVLYILPLGKFSDDSGKNGNDYFRKVLISESRKSGQD